MRNKIKTNKKNIVILGSGFCGLHAAKRLAKNLRGNTNYQIILVDRRDATVYNGELYEISSAYNKRITAACLRVLKECVSTSISQVLQGLEVIFVKDSVTGIDPKSKKVVLQTGGELPYEFLVLALGSVTNFYGIPGLEEHSYPMKTLEDALALNCHFDQFFQERWRASKEGGKSHQKVHIVVGGGGFTGVEFACELMGCIKKLARKYKFKTSEVSISIVQGSKEFVGLGETVSSYAYKRFKKLEIHPVTGGRIASYDGKIVSLSMGDGSKKDMPADILVWTGGIKPNPLLKSFEILDPSGAMEVHQNLESPHYPGVYAGGDAAAIFDPRTGNLVPKLALMAIPEGNLIADNIAARINGNPQKMFVPFLKGFLIPMGGKYFVYNKGRVTFGGFIPYIMRRIIDLYYYMSLLPAAAAFRKWKHTETIFIQND
jgi:NADH dehydrogenase